MSLPAVIGLIPMPAGALFSAPFVGKAGTAIEEAGAWKSAVNYWFRHTWEYWWPLYPGVIVAMKCFDMIETWQFISVMFVFTPLSIITGYVFLIRPHIEKLAKHGKTTEHKIDHKRVFVLFTPLVIVITAVLVGPKIFDGLDVKWLNKGIMASLISMIAGLAVAVGLIALDEKGPGNRMFTTVFTKRSFSVLLSLAGVMVFKYMLEKSLLLPDASQELVQSRIPVAGAVMLLPFIAGFVTGVAFGFTGTAFPLVAGLMLAEGSDLTPLSTLVLAYGFGYMGMICSPVHLCLLATRDYFGSSLFPIYRRLMPCILTVLVFSVILYYILG
jgi:integral membrane protein (TIGR00529 family)